MYPENPEQAVNMRGLARRMRERARQTEDSYYRRMFQNAALDLETGAECAERVETPDLIAPAKLRESGSDPENGD